MGWRRLFSQPTGAVISARVRFRGQRQRNAGFTIVELVVVMLLLGTLSAVAFSRFIGPSAFTPSIVTQQLRAELMIAQTQAGNRQDAQVSFELIGVANGWRLQTSNDIDGVVREVTLDRDDTVITASSGSTSAALSTTGALRIDFDGLGGVSQVTVAGVAGSAADGAELVVTGSSSRTLCVYPTGYVNAEPCA